MCLIVLQGVSHLLNLNSAPIHTCSYEVAIMIYRSNDTSDRFENTSVCQLSWNNLPPIGNDGMVVGIALPSTNSPKFMQLSSESCFLNLRYIIHSGWPVSMYRACIIYFSSAVFVHYQLDNYLQRNPYQVWSNGGQPVYPPYTLLQAMREAAVSYICYWTLMTSFVELTGQTTLTNTQV